MFLLENCRCFSKDCRSVGGVNRTILVVSGKKWKEQNYRSKYNIDNENNTRKKSKEINKKTLLENFRLC